MENDKAETNESIALAHQIVCLMERFTATDDIKLAALKIAKAVVKTGSLFTRGLSENE